MTDEDDIRRDFAASWAGVGAAWGIAPSTAAVQGYFLVHGGPLTETELRAALGMSHRAAFAALAECEAWGLIEPAAPQRSGRRGPASRAWVVVGDPGSGSAGSRRRGSTGRPRRCCRWSRRAWRGRGRRTTRTWSRGSRRWASSRRRSTGGRRRSSRPMRARSGTSWGCSRGWTRRRVGAAAGVAGRGPRRGARGGGRVGGADAAVGPAAAAAARIPTGVARCWTRLG